MNVQYQLGFMFGQFCVPEYGAFVMQQICRHIEAICNILIKSVGGSWSLELRIPTSCLQLNRTRIARNAICQAEFAVFIWQRRVARPPNMVMPAPICGECLGINLERGIES